MLVNKVFTMMQAFQKQKSSRISLRADYHSWRSGLGWQTLCRVNRCNISQEAKFKQKSSQISLRADCHSGGVGGIRTHARGKPSNDLAKMPKLQFVVLALNLPLYIVFIHCEILLKTFWLHHKYMEQRGTIIGTTETKGTLYLVFVISTNLPNCTPP